MTLSNLYLVGYFQKYQAIILDIDDLSPAEIVDLRVKAKLANEESPLLIWKT